MRTPRWAGGGERKLSGKTTHILPRPASKQQEWAKYWPDTSPATRAPRATRAAAFKPKIPILETANLDAEFVAILEDGKR